MKKLLASLLAVAAMGALSACNALKPDSSTAEYDVEFGTLSDCYYDDTVTLPEIFITLDGEVVEEEYAVSVIDPNGAAVTVENGSFVAAVIGEYTITVTMGEVTETLTFECKKPQKAAVTDLSVSADGVVTFTASDGDTYTLYVGDEAKGAVTSGMNIVDKLSEGVNSVTVVADGNENYLASEKSNVAQIEKVATVKDFAVDENFVLSFTEESGVIYEFYLNGSTEALSFNSGDTILNYLEMGENTVYIIAKKNGAITSGASETFKIDLNNYVPLDDVAVADGAVTFTETSGLSYKLYVNGEDRGAVTSGAALAGYMTAAEQLATVDIQVQIAADDSYGASALSNTARYFYNKGFLGSVVYDGSTRIKDTFGKITDVTQAEEEGVKYMRFQGDTVETANCQIFASVKFDTPLTVAADATKVNYLRLKVRLAETGNGIYAYNRGSFSVYGDAYSACLVHLYDSNYRGKWCDVEIQLPKDLTQVEGFYLEIAQAVNYETTYVDVASAEIVSYATEVETSLGVWNTASINGYGKDSTKWSVPYEVEEVEETVTVGDASYDKYVKLSKDTDVTFGGNISFANAGTTVAGALLNYDFSSYSSNNVVVSITLKADKDIVIEGLTNKPFTKTNVVAVSGEWQTVEVTMKLANLQGIAFLSINNEKNYSEVPDICIAAISVAEVPAPPIAQNVAISTGGVVTFTAEEGYTYNLLDGAGTVIKENVQSGDTTEIKAGLNEFVVQTLSAEGETSESDPVVIFNSAIGYGVNTHNPRSASNEIKYAEEGVDGVTALKATGAPASGVSVGGGLILKQPIATVEGKINYAVITYRTPDSWRSLNRISFGANNSKTLLVHSYDNGGLSEAWIQAYIQLPAETTSLESIYFDIAQSNGFRETWLWISEVKVESYDTAIETSLGSWTVASINGFGKNSAQWSVPYTVTESEEAVTVGETTYNKVVKLTDETYSFGGNTTFANAGTYHTGALFNYTYTGAATHADITLLVKISAGSKIAIAAYNGSAVDKTTNVVVGTGEWQEITVRIAVADVKGFTFVAVNNGTNYVSPSTVELAAITTKELQISGVTDLAVATDGTLTFTAANEHTYALYNGTTLVSEDIVSGEKVTINEGNNVFSLKITYAGMETTSNEVVIFNSAVGYGVTTHNPRSESKAITYTEETVDSVTALKAKGTPSASAKVGGGILLKQPIATVEGKINYAVITYRTPDSWRALNRISFGANNSTSMLVHSYDNGGLSEAWIRAYIQLPAETTSLESIYFDIAQSNSYRETWLWISQVKVESYDTAIETSLGSWTVASINGFGKNSAQWSVPYTVTESEEAVTVGETTYNKVVKLTNETYSFGGNVTWANAGTYSTGALLNYTYSGEESTVSMKLLVKISAGSKIAIAMYNGSAVDKSNVIVGTDEWQEVTFTATVADLKGFTFVAVNDGTHYVSPSTVEIAAVTASKLEISVVSDLAVSADGTLTFKETDGHTYALYNGETLVNEDIVSGEKITFADGSNVLTLKISYAGMEATSNAVELFNSAAGYGVKTLNPRSKSNEVTYTQETVDDVAALKASLAPASGVSVGGSVLLKQPIATPTDKVNYAVVTFRMPDSWRQVTQMSIGANNTASTAAHNFGCGLSDSWVQAYVQLPAGTNSLTSIFFDVAQSNSYRATYIWISEVKVESYDTAIETSLGSWTVASINGFGKNSAQWSVPYTVTESEETVTVGETTYNKVVKLTNETYSFGGNVTWANAGTHHTGALLTYTTDSAETTVTVKLGVKISVGSKIAIAGYNGTVDKTTNIVVGTGEWQEIELTVTVAGLQGITFVAVNDGTNFVSPSTVEIIYVK